MRCDAGPPSSTHYPYTTLIRSRGLLRKEGIRYRTVRVSGNAVVVELRSQEDRDNALRLANRELEGLSIEATQSGRTWLRSEEHTSELQSRGHLVCRLMPDNKT